MKTYNKFDVLYPSLNMARRHLINIIETNNQGVIEITTLNETTWQVPIAMALVMQVRDGKPFIVIG